MPFAKDGQGNLVHIKDAIPGQQFYRCIECGHHVHARQGAIYAWGFAHNDKATAPPESRQCSLRSEEGAKTLTSPDLLERRPGEATLAVLPNWELESAQLCMVLPTLAHVAPVSAVVRASLAAEGACLRENVGENHFQPAEPECDALVDAEADRLEVIVKANMPVKGLTGAWKADPVREGDVFFGSDRRAIRPTKRQRGATGDVAYVVAAPSTSLTNILGEFNLGSKRLVALSASDLMGEGNHGFAPFDAALLLPARLGPSLSAPLELGEDEDAVISIKMKDGASTIPLEIQQTGKGQAMLEGVSQEKTVRIPRDAERRLMRLRQGPTDLLLDIRRTTPAPNPQIPTPCLEFRGQTARFLGDDIELPTASERVAGHLSIRAPASLPAVVITTEGDRRYTHRCNAQEIPQTVVEVLARQEKLVEIRLENLGSIHIKQGAKRRLRETELQALLKRISPTGKMRWRQIREALGVEPGTAHDALPSGIKKALRRIRRQQ